MNETEIGKQHLGETGTEIENQSKLPGKLLFIWEYQPNNNQKVNKMMPGKGEERKKYAHIPHKLRLELIDLIEKENYPLSVASDLLGVKLSTAKLIMTKYKSRGYVTKYKSEKIPEHQSNSQTIPKRRQKKTAKFAHPHKALCNAEHQKEPEPNEICHQSEIQEKRNETQIPFENTCFAMVPWNGLMFPFVYIWNTPQ